MTQERSQIPNLAESIAHEAIKYPQTKLVEAIENFWGKIQHIADVAGLEIGVESDEQSPGGRNVVQLVTLINTNDHKREDDAKFWHIGLAEDFIHGQLGSSIPSPSPIEFHIAVIDRFPGMNHGQIFERVAEGAEHRLSLQVA